MNNATAIMTPPQPLMGVRTKCARLPSLSWGAHSAPMADQLKEYPASPELVAELQKDEKAIMRLIDRGIIATGDETVSVLNRATQTFVRDARKEKARRQ